MADPAGPRPAPPDERSVLLGAFDKELRRKWPRTFAGLAITPDGTLDVLSTGDPAVNEFASRFAAEHSDFRLRVVPGMRNSLLDLEAVRDKIHERVGAGQIGQVKVLGYGVDIRSNCVRIGIADLSPEGVRYLQDEFGPDRVCVEKGSLWSPSESGRKGDVHRPDAIG